MLFIKTGDFIRIDLNKYICVSQICSIEMNDDDDNEQSATITMSNGEKDFVTQELAQEIMKMTGKQ